jgi:isoleucyl-tRNA synthetase
VVALDLTLTDSLRNRGLSRDVVRLVQDLRKTSGLDVSDRIELWLTGLDQIAEHFDYIAREVLAVSVTSGDGPGEGTVLELETDEGAVEAQAWLRKVEGPTA